VENHDDAGNDTQYNDTYAPARLLHQPIYLGEGSFVYIRDNAFQQHCRDKPA
jgi:hypothetical protein